jgi:ABC-2 type transport system permease protein
MSGNKTAADYILFMLNLLFNAIVIYVVVLASGTITNELKEGTIKLLLLRPIDRNKLLSIKLFSIMMVGLILMLIILVLSLVYGLLRFGASNLPVIFIFNAKNVFIGSQVGQVALIFITEFIMVFGFVEMAAFFATLTKNKSFAMAVTIAIMLGITSMLISLLEMIGWNVSQWLFSKNANFSAHFSTSAPDYSFYFTVVLFTIYVFIFSFFNHLIFSKRDIN